MPLEKITEIRVKRLAIKRNTIKEDDDLGIVPELRNMLEFDIDVTKHITTKERQWRTRSTILQSTGKVKIYNNYYAALNTNIKIFDLAIFKHC